MQRCIKAMLGVWTIIILTQSILLALLLIWAQKFTHVSSLALQRCMKVMLGVWTNITLTRAFNGWLVAAQELKDKHALQTRAAAFWSSRELAQVQLMYSLRLSQSSCYCIRRPKM